MSTFFPEDSGNVGATYLNSMLSGLFGSGRASWAPSSFTAVLGDTEVGDRSMTATIPNDDTHWGAINGPTVPISPYELINGGYTNLQRITFSPVTTADVGHFGNTYIKLKDGSGNLVWQAVTASFVQYHVGLVVLIGPQNLIFGLG